MAKKERGSQSLHFLSLWEFLLLILVRLGTLKWWFFGVSSSGFGFWGGRSAWGLSFLGLGFLIFTLLMSVHWFCAAVSMGLAMMLSKGNQRRSAESKISSSLPDFFKRDQSMGSRLDGGDLRDD